MLQQSSKVSLLHTITAYFSKIMHSHAFTPEIVHDKYTVTVMFTPNIRMRKRCDLLAFDGGTDCGIMAGLCISHSSLYTLHTVV